MATEEAGLFVVLAVLAAREAREAMGGGCACKPAAVLRLDRIFRSRPLAALIPPPDSESLLGLLGGGPLATV